MRWGEILILCAMFGDVNCTDINMDGNEIAAQRWTLASERTAVLSFEAISARILIALPAWSLCEQLGGRPLARRPPAAVQALAIRDAQRLAADVVGAYRH